MTSTSDDQASSPICLNPGQDYGTIVPQKEQPKSKSACLICWGWTSLLIILFLILAIVALFVFEPPAKCVSTDESESVEIVWPEYSSSSLDLYTTAAVAATNQLCSEIGRDILMKGGNAVDAAIGAAACIGVIEPENAGLGGGHIMTIYNRTRGRCHVVDAREVAPLGAYEEMFLNRSSEEGWASVGVPGEVHGFFTEFTNFGSGKVSWSKLLEPTRQLLVAGVPVEQGLATALFVSRQKILREPTMRVFVDPKTGDIYQPGDLIKKPALAETFRKLMDSEDPIRTFYDGEMTNSIVAEFGKHAKEGSVMSRRDFETYKSKIRPSDTIIESDIQGTSLRMCGPPPPSSAANLQGIIKILAEYGPETNNKNFDNEELTYHRFVEAMKFQYAQRDRLGDYEFVPEALELAKNMSSTEFAKLVKSKIGPTALPFEAYGGQLATKEDHGTAHVSVIDKYGNAAAITSSINKWFGSVRRSESTGIIWNDSMDDFSTPGVKNGFPPSPTNFIVPKKRPMSSTVPTVIYNKDTGEVSLVVGGSSGSKIISGVANVILRSLFFNETIKDAVDRPRFHNQWVPHETYYGTGMPQEFVDALRDRGQTMKARSYVGVVNAVKKLKNGLLGANSDRRKGLFSQSAGY